MLERSALLQIGPPRWDYEGRIDRTIPNVFSPDEGATVGMDDETVVTDDYRERDNRFTGRLGKIVIDVK